MRQPAHNGQTSSLIRTAGAAVFAVALVGPDANAEPGDHIRVGAAEITPSVVMGVNWNSNVYRTAGDLGGEQGPESGANLRTGPRLQVALDSSDAVMTANAAYYLRKYFNPDFANLGVGVALTLEVADWCAGHGLRIYDFLPPLTDFKAEWADHERVVRQVVCPLRARGRLFVPAVRDGRRLAKKAWTSLMPEELAQRLFAS